MHKNHMHQKLFSNQNRMKTSLVITMLTYIQLAALFKFSIPLNITQHTVFTTFFLASLFNTEIVNTIKCNEKQGILLTINKLNQK